MHSPEVEDTRAKLSELEASNLAETIPLPQVKKLREIQETLASVVEDIPVPDKLSEYPKVVKQFFVDRKGDENLRVNILISPLDEHPDRLSILSQIAEKLREGIFEYFGEQMGSAGADKVPGIKAIIGERVQNVRYAEANSTLQKITVILGKRLGKIYIDLINAANTPTNVADNKNESDHDKYSLHGLELIIKAEADVENGGMVDVQRDSFTIKEESDPDAKIVAYESVVEFDFKVPESV